MTSMPPEKQPTGNPRPPRRFRDTVLASGLVTAAQIDSAEAEIRLVLGPAATPEAFDKALADVLVRRRELTAFQAEQLLEGRRKLTLGQYRILDAIGQGGMGRVFKAEHAMMGREVAIKVLPREKSTPETEAAFQREIRMLARLDHENLVRALDAGHDGKVYYMVTELIDGVDLRRQVLKFGLLDEVTAASVISQAARGLAYAHGQGIVHRDVKPGNLLVTADGRVKVLDLGLAGSSLESEAVRLGRVVGTMDYMAPEQIGHPDDVGPAADIYGLGCTLYFALAGQVPFPGGSKSEKAERHRVATAAPIRQFAPQVSDAFSAVVEAMMRKDPDERPASAEEVIERLRPWAPDAPVAMPRTRRTSGLSPRKPTQQAGSDISARGIFSFSDGAPGSSGGHAARRDAGGTGRPRPAGWLRSLFAGGSGLVRGSMAQLLQQRHFIALCGTALRMLVVAWLVGFVFKEVIARLNEAIPLLHPDSAVTTGRLAFWLMLGAQAVAAFSARRGRR
jgi:serine/threonine protein kinase